MKVSADYGDGWSRVASGLTQQVAETVASTINAPTKIEEE